MCIVSVDRMQLSSDFQIYIYAGGNWMLGVVFLQDNLLICLLCLPAER